MLGSDMIMSFNRFLCCMKCKEYVTTGWYMYEITVPNEFLRKHYAHHLEFRDEEGTGTMPLLEKDDDNQWREFKC